LESIAEQNKFGFSAEEEVANKEEHQAATTTSYKFSTSKLRQCPSDKTPVVLLACGSFNPLTVMHLRMMGLFLLFTLSM
jgi:hypothetical protein